MAHDKVQAPTVDQDVAERLQMLIFSDPDETDGEVDAAARREIAVAALDLMASKPAGRPKIRARGRVGMAGGATVLEILNDDMPFLVDSVMGEVRARGLTAHRMLHPTIKTARAADGTLEAILGPGDRNWGDGRQESLIILILDEIGDEAASKLTEAIGETLAQVRLAVADWQSMLDRFDKAIKALEAEPPPIAPGLMSESLAFCRWLRDGQFTFLGCREYRLMAVEGSTEQVPVEGSGLGVLRDPSLHVIGNDGDALVMTPEISRFLLNPQPLIIAKSNILSRIHRRVVMDYVGLKIYAKDGKLVGELRIVGLFTSQAYTQAARLIPFLRHKVENVLQQSGFAAGSHDSKALANVLETFPRDELFQIGEAQLLEWARGIVDLELRPRVRVFVRRDRFDRYVSALVYVQRDRFTTAARERIAALLCGAYRGQLTSFTPFFPEGPLVRVHFIISCKPSAAGDVAISALEDKITEITRTWDDRLAAQIQSAGRSHALLAAKYGGAFSAGYAETFTAGRALEDIDRIERLSDERPVAIDFYREADQPAIGVRAAVYRFDKPIPLSERVPVLENLGFSVIDERSYRVHPQVAGNRREVALHDMVLETADRAPLDLESIDRRMEDAYLAVFRGDADNDPFNRLVVLAGAEWREVAMVRAYAAYMRQIRSPFGLRYIAETLNRHAGVARDLIELFHIRFDPRRFAKDGERRDQETKVRARIEGALSAVQSLDEDRILRSFLNLISVTVRTSFYRTEADGCPARTLAFKLDSKHVDGSPEPRPYREIWVYHPRVEGIHLRFAPIARGGIRWSDRAQDFRTEVLGLCKAQQVKNTVIVPAGAKGGFLPKMMPRAGTRDEIMKEGIDSYRIFISALLDLTDNLAEGRIVPPLDVVRHDGDDPYLVVAADKGTATFSDYANALAQERGFWLDDAFASGGSAGYDHKKMAITARGAWECVKRHFREIDIDIQTTPFTVVGVGDMSGDVFGNGMLLSPVIKLVAAFDHRDIFVDPAPDPATGFAERKRLFEMPRSSWQDYDRSKISSGGGVFARSAKSISLSPEARAALGMEIGTVTPAQLISAILRCESDLLWFGGIGTYVRATSETDEQAGDRANDGIRVTAQELRAKVVGEGANLGITQRGRIEFAARGGRINTDFIDNSAGVNSSDQEVNIKIAIAPAVLGGRLSGNERGAFLASMTGDVANSCLVNNIHQSLAISLAERNSARDASHHLRLMIDLESRGLLDRKLEALPSNVELRSREAAGRGLTRPEIAVLLSFAKIALDHDLLASNVPDDPACQQYLYGYFPPALRERFAEDIAAHRLRREIIATFIVNAMINRGGPAFIVRMADETSRGPADIARAFLAAREYLGMSAIWAELHALGGRISGQLQLELYAGTQDAVIEQTTEVLRYGGAAGIASLAATNARTMEALTSDLASVLTPRQMTRIADAVAGLEANGVTKSLAQKLSLLAMIGSVPALSWLAASSGRKVGEVAAVGFAAAEFLRTGELKARSSKLKLADGYDRLALGAAINTLDAATRELTREVLAGAGDGPADFQLWLGANGQRLARAKASLEEIVDGGELTVSRMTVAAARLREVAVLT